MVENKQKGSASDHLANERTLLAWTRTSIGIMAFGFVVVKFSLFVKQLSLVLGKEYILPSRGYSAIMGILLVVVGASTTVFSYIRYKRTEKQLTEGVYDHSSLLITLLTALIFLVSIFLTVYLIESA